ncbi:MAG: VWA domain-containing protein [Vicinamibacteria bacterium]|nr:VWA domain-containing protein [Vicinamibacteria bacterium]
MRLKPPAARLVLVDALVTDSKGRPIADLQQEDFELREDGRLVDIAAFQAPRGGLAEAAARTGLPEAQAAPKGAEREPLSVVIYVDRQLLSPPGRKHAIDQAAALAESYIAKGARALVIADDNGLRPLSALTGDIVVIRAALARIQGWNTESAGAAEGARVTENIRARIEAGEVEKCDCLCLLPELVSMIRGYATFRAVEARDAATRLALVAGALGGIPGRKALVYVSEGLEQRPGIHLYDQLGTICPEVFRKDASAIYAPMQEFETSASLREATARANAARVTLYPLDSRGLTTLSTADVSQGDRRYVAAARSDNVREANLVNPYRLLADETGGVAIIRGMDPSAAMKRLDADERGHYVIGFIPGDPDGRTHSLTVSLNSRTQMKRNADIRHRRSYLRAELPERRGQRALSVLLFGLEENMLDAAVDVRRMSATVARVHVSIPLRALKALPGPGPAQGRAQIVVSFRPAGSGTNPVQVREKDLTYDLTAEDLSRDGGRRDVVIDVPIGDGDYDFGIGVEDVASGYACYLRRSVGDSPRGAGGGPGD